jgi:uncharacterized membrane protein
MIESILLITTGVLTTLLTGTFFGYAVSVNGALHTLRDDEYVRAMQAINTVIQNPLFFLSFMGPVILLPVSTFLAYGDNSMQFWLLLLATIIYIVGTFGVTVVGNVPLNEQLAKADPATAREARTRFEKPWNRLHTIRTVAGIITTTLFFIACIH